MNETQEQRERQEVKRCNELTAAQLYYLRKGKQTGVISTMEIKENVARALAHRGLITLEFNASLFQHYWKLTDAGRERINLHS